MADTGRIEGGYLNGIRVLELADETGEYAGRVLAGLGADVVKVEPPEGEATRQIGSFRGDVAAPEESLHFWHYNLGKRSIALDLDKPDGQESFLRLASVADIVLDARPRGYLDAFVYLDEIRKPGLYEEIWQAFAVLLRTVGVKSDGRTYD